MRGAASHLLRKRRHRASHLRVLSVEMRFARHRRGACHCPWRPRTPMLLGAHSAVVSRWCDGVLRRIWFETSRSPFSSPHAVFFRNQEAKP